MESSIDRELENPGESDAAHSSGSTSEFVGMVGCFAALLVMFFA